MRIKNFLVLVTGDNTDCQNQFRDAFTELGYIGKYECLGSGAGLLSYLGEIYSPSAGRLLVPPLVLLDLGLPYGDGMEIVRQIKSNDRFKFVPVIVFTASDDPTIISACYGLGANSVIVKPNDTAGMRRVIREFYTYWLQTAALSHHVAPTQHR